VLSVSALFYDRVRLAIAVSGLAFAVLLVLLLRGIMDGTIAKSTAYVDHVGADVFVASAGVRNMSLAASLLPEDLVAELGKVPGVERAAGITNTNAILSSGEAVHPAQVIGYDPGAGLGGPWKLTAGREVNGPGEIVIDSLLSETIEAPLGATVRVLGRDFTVVGLSGATATIAAKPVFIRLDAAQALFQIEGLVNFVLISAEASAEAGRLAEAVQAAAGPSVSVLTRSDLSARDRKLLSELFVRPVSVMSTVGFLVGLAISALTMYTTTAERLRDFGVLRAIGAPNGYLFRTVLAQGLILGALGFALGLAATLAAKPAVEATFPDLGVTIGTDSALRDLGALLAAMLAGAVLPVVRIMRTDPLIVFRRAA
jgi:putative ABC transport system permease protein